MAGTIQSVKSRQIFDSRGKPTVEVRRTRPSPVRLPLSQLLFVCLLVRVLIGSSSVGYGRPSEPIILLTFCIAIGGSWVGGYLVFVIYMSCWKSSKLYLPDMS